MTHLRITRIPSFLFSKYFIKISTLDKKKKKLKKTLSCNQQVTYNTNL